MDVLCAPLRVPPSIQDGNATWKKCPNPRSSKQTGRKVVYQTSGYDAHDCWCVKNNNWKFYVHHSGILPSFQLGNARWQKCPNLRSNKQVD